jgi:hypothetical protein
LDHWVALRVRSLSWPSLPLLLRHSASRYRHGDANIKRCSRRFQIPIASHP